METRSQEPTGDAGGAMVGTAEDAGGTVGTGVAGAGAGPPGWVAQPQVTRARRRTKRTRRRPFCIPLILTMVI
jgi:hypothetical protein